jgi:hypothetical protein
LGLQPVAPLHTLLVDPVLPPWLPEVIVRNLRIGDAIATVRFHRGADDRGHADVLEQRGNLHIVHQPPPESLDATMLDRLAALLKSLWHH